MDAPRKLLLDTLARRPDLALDGLSVAIGCNHAYLHQYVMRGSPRELPEAVRQALAPLLGVSPEALRPGRPGDAPAGQAGPSEGPTAQGDLPVYSVR